MRIESLIASLDGFLRAYPRRGPQAFYLRRNRVLSFIADGRTVTIFLPQEWQSHCKPQSSTKETSSARPRLQVSVWNKVDPYMKVAVVIGGAILFLKHRLNGCLRTVKKTSNR